jgi:hypothetical protein
VKASRGLVGAVCLAAAAATAQDRSALLDLDRAGRAITVQACKRPQEQKSSKVGSTGDEMRALDCGHFRLAIYVARTSGGDREMPMALVVLGPGLELPAGIAPGMPAAEVAQRLGPPTRQKPGSLSYLLDPARPGGDVISFELDGERVRAVSWNWRVDDR